MKQIFVTRTAFFLTVVEASRAHGFPIERELERCGLPVNIEENPDGIISLNRVLQFCGNVGKEIGDLRLARDTAGLVGLETLRSEFQADICRAVSGVDLIYALIRHTPMEDNSLTVRIVPQDQDIWIVFDHDLYNGKHDQIATEWQAVASVVSLVQAVAGPDWLPREVRLKFREVLSEEEEAQFFAAKVSTGFQSTAVRVPRADLAMPCPIPDRIEEIEAFLQASRESKDNPLATLDVAVRQLIKPYLSERRPTLKMTADLVSSNPRTLQRRLATNGVSFAQIVSSARLEVAYAHIANSSMKLIDVSYACGYASPQHFSRAFKRATGLTPSEYRKNIFKQK